MLFGDLNDPKSEIAQRIAAVADDAGPRRPQPRHGRALRGPRSSPRDDPDRRPSPSHADSGLCSPLGVLVVLAGLFRRAVMETHGHIVTGMNNRIVWGLPHVFAIFLIVAASGVLNVASIGSVFRQAAYKPQRPCRACCASRCWPAGWRC